MPYHRSLEDACRDAFWNEFRKVKRHPHPDLIKCIDTAKDFNILVKRLHGSRFVDADGKFALYAAFNTAKGRPGAPRYEEGPERMVARWFAVIAFAMARRASCVADPSELQDWASQDEQAFQAMFHDADQQSMAEKVRLKVADGVKSAKFKMGLKKVAKVEPKDRLMEWLNDQEEWEVVSLEDTEVDDLDGFALLRLE